MHSLKSAASVLAILSLLCTTSQAGEAPLDAQSIKKLIPGQHEARFKSYKVLFAADRAGRLAGRAHGVIDRGQWYMRGNQLCVVWKQWTEGMPKCGAIWQRGKWFVASNNEGVMLTFRPLSVVAQN